MIKSTFTRRSLLAGVAATTTAFTFAAHAQADYPDRSKPIRLVIPFAPGGVTDTSGRLIAERLTQRLGVQVVPDNRPGASGSIGTSAVANAVPDGYTLLLALDGSLVINPHTMANLSNFQPTQALTPVGKIGDSTIILVAHPSVSARNLRDVIELSKKGEGLSYGSSGTASIVHIAGELLAQRSGAKLTHVPYKGGAPAVADVLGGHIPLAFVSAASVHGYLSAGKLIAIAVPSAKRSPSYPNVPSFAEANLPGFDVNSWVGLMAPRNTPPGIVNKLNTALNEILADADVQSRLKAMGIEATPTTPQQFTDLIAQDYKRFGEVVKAAGIRLE